MTPPSRNWCFTWFCIATLVVSVALSYPVAEIGVADDFSYSLSAEVLARTGKVAYNGWSTALLGVQLYWGALFYRVFGYTQFAVRLSGLVVAAVTTGLLHRTLLRCGLTSRNAVIGTLTVTLSPLFLPLSYSFMSDVPGLLCLLVSLYCAIRAFIAFREEHASSKVLGWLVAGVVLGVALGTARQIAWLSVLVTMPNALFLVRRRKTVALWGLTSWILGCAVVAGMLHWFQMQPYSLREEYVGPQLSIARIVVQLTQNALRAALELPMAVLPVTLGFVCLVAWSKRKIRVLALVSASGLIATAIRLIMHHQLRTWLQPTLFGVQTDRGMWFNIELDSWNPIVLAAGWRIVASVLALTAMFSVAAVLLSPTPHSSEPIKAKGVLSNRELHALFVPTLIAYALMLVPRAATYTVFDRYLLFLMVGATALLLRFGQSYSQVGAQRIAAICIVVLGFYSIETNHDMFALRRAKLRAIDSLRQLGVSRANIRGGLEFDGTTEIIVAGHINDSRINPRRAFVPTTTDDWRVQSFRHVVPLFSVPVVPSAEACTELAPAVPVGNWLGEPLAVETIPANARVSVIPARPCRG